MEQTLHPQDEIYKPSSDFFKCSLCKQIFSKPITLQCGHTFCQSCLINWIQKRRINSQGQNLISSIPFCPTCETMIWKPIIELKQNVTISALISKFKFNSDRAAQPINLNLVQNPHFHIMIEIQKTKFTLMPHCYTQVVFATAFIDQILEQQSLSNFVIVRWPSEDRTFAIAGKLIRPETYHQSIKSNRYETVFRAVFEGKFFVRIKQEQIVSLKVNYHNTYNNKQEIRSSLALCQIEQIHSKNPIPLAQLQQFFEVYDKLNTPVYLRQIAQLVNEKVLNERNSPQNLIYCVIRLLRFNQNEVNRLALMMDDRERWNQIQEFLIKNSGRAAIQIIKIDIPGRYPHAFVFTILIIMLLLQFLAK